jgi:hypothetical protein
MAFHMTRWRSVGRAARASPYSAQAKRSFIKILSDPDGHAPEFLCPEEDPVTVNLTDEERHQLELAI